MYVITNGTLYIYFDKNGKISMTSNIKAATQFGTENKACNLLSSLPKRIKRMSGAWKVLLIDDEFKGNNVKDKNKSSSNNMYVKNDEDILLCTENLDKLNKLIINTQEAVCAIEFIKIHKDDYYKLESYYDKQTSDILHKIEFSTFNACIGYKYAKMLKDIRISRRKVKNILKFLNEIEPELWDNVVTMNSKLQNVQKRSYKPRVLSELFEDI